MCNVKYIVKPEANLVVCEIREDYETRFRGIAKCNPTDTFNEETGKKIAYLRANIKRKRAYANFMRYQEKHIDQQINWLYDQKRRVEKQIKNAQVSICKCKDEIIAAGKEND